MVTPYRLWHRQYIPVIGMSESLLNTFEEQLLSVRKTMLDQLYRFFPGHYGDIWRLKKAAPNRSQDSWRAGYKPQIPPGAF